MEQYTTRQYKNSHVSWMFRIVFELKNTITGANPYFSPLSGYSGAYQNAYQHAHINKRLQIRVYGGVYSRLHVCFGLSKSADSISTKQRELPTWCISKDVLRYYILPRSSVNEPIRGRFDDFSRLIFYDINNRYTPFIARKLEFRSV